MLLVVLPRLGLPLLAPPTPLHKALRHIQKSWRDFQLFCFCWAQDPQSIPGEPAIHVSACAADHDVVGSEPPKMAEEQYVKMMDNPARFVLLRRTGPEIGIDLDNCGGSLRISLLTSVVVASVPRFP